MFKQVFVVFFLALVNHQVENVLGFSSYQGLFDDAKLALDELRQIVTGNIFVAHDQLDVLFLDFQQFSSDVLKTGIVDIQDEFIQVYARLTTIKELAHSANVNISTCLVGREDYLAALPETTAKNLEYCVVDKVKDASKTVNDSKYFVDISINRVEDLEFQLKLCGENASDLVIQPLLDEIELETVKLPEKIKLEVTRAKSLVETLRVSASECSSLKISEFISDSNRVIVDISNCVNNIIGVIVDTFM